jgi:hypothetical protein
MMVNSTFSSSNMHEVIDEFHVINDLILVMISSSI